MEEIEQAVESSAGQLATQAQSAVDLVLGWLAVQGLAVVWAIVILVVGWRLARAFKGWSERYMQRSDRMDPTVEVFLSSLIYYFVLAVTLITVLHLFGVQTTSLVAVLGAASLAVGLALQGSLTSLAAGVMLLLIRPFNVGQYVDIDGTAGTVKNISLFTTELATFDNIQVILPNNKCWGATITNYSAYPRRMLDVTVALDYGDDVSRALDTLRRLAAADPRVSSDPAPDAFVNRLGDSGIELVLRLWCAADDYWPLKRDLDREAVAAISAEGLTIPYPQIVVTHRGGGPPSGEATPAPASAPRTRQGRGKAAGSTGAKAGEGSPGGS